MDNNSLAHTKWECKERLYDLPEFMMFIAILIRFTFLIYSSVLLSALTINEYKSR